jgi:hypothetical protein
MKHNLIPIDDYLFVIGGNYKSNVFPYLVIEKLTTGEYTVWQVDNPNDWNEKNQYKILAHLPLNGARYLDGIDVLPSIPQHQKDDVEEKSYQFVREIGGSQEQRLAFKDGYFEAREKYNLTWEKLIDLYIEETGYGMDMWGKEENKTMLTITKIIQSLQQPIPIAFECELFDTQVRDINTHELIKGRKKTITNSEGRIEWVGKYVS